MTTKTTATTSVSNESVSFKTQTDELLQAPYRCVVRNPVLRMLHQYSSETEHCVRVEEESSVFANLLRHLKGEPLALHEWELTELLMNLRCAHKYQAYQMATGILLPLMTLCRSHNVLHIYAMIFTFPELPPLQDSSAPSAPTISQLNDSDPEQSEFITALNVACKQCLQLIDEKTVEVLTSDALLALTEDQLMNIAQRDTLSARELEIGRALLRWCRHHSLHGSLTTGHRRCLVLSTLRLLTMKTRDLRRLELQREGVVGGSEWEALLEYTHHGTGQLPDSLTEFGERWMEKRRGPSTAASRRGILQCFSERPLSKTLPTSVSGAAARRVRFESKEATDRTESEETERVARHEASLERRKKRADKLKLVLATGASILLD